MTSRSTDNLQHTGGGRYDLLCLPDPEILMDGEFFRGCREAVDLTQRELAYYMGVARNTVSRWETGRLAIPHIAKVAVLAIRDQLWRACSGCGIPRPSAGCVVCAQPDVESYGSTLKPLSTEKGMVE